VPAVALLVSESAFTRNCLLAAHASPLPFLLVHLPPLTAAAAGGGGVARGRATTAALGAVFGNPALVSARGVLRGELEIRWERRGGTTPSGGALDDGARGGGGGGSGRPGLWWRGQPLPSWTPDAEVDGTVVDQW